MTENREPTESPLHLAKRLGLLSLRHKTGYETVTFDGLLELAAVALLDEFDRITGRTDFPEVAEHEWRRIAEAVGAS